MDAEMPLNKLNLQFLLCLGQQHESKSSKSSTKKIKNIPHDGRNSRTITVAEKHDTEYVNKKNVDDDNLSLDELSVVDYDEHNIDSKSIQSIKRNERVVNSEKETPYKVKLQSSSTATNGQINFKTTNNSSDRENETNEISKNSADNLSIRQNTRKDVGMPPNSVDIKSRVRTILGIGKSKNKTIQHDDKNEKKILPTRKARADGTTDGPTDNKNNGEEGIIKKLPVTDSNDKRIPRENTNKEFSVAEYVDHKMDKKISNYGKKRENIMEEVSPIFNYVDEKNNKKVPLTINKGENIIKAVSPVNNYIDEPKNKKIFVPKNKGENITKDVPPIVYNVDKKKGKSISANKSKYESTISEISPVNEDGDEKKSRKISKGENIIKELSTVVDYIDEKKRKKKSVIKNNGENVVKERPPSIDYADKKKGEKITTTVPEINVEENSQSDSVISTNKSQSPPIHTDATRLKNDCCHNAANAMGVDPHHEAHVIGFMNVLCKVIQSKS